MARRAAASGFVILVNLEKLLYIAFDQQNYFASSQFPADSSLMKNFANQCRYPAPVAWLLRKTLGFAAELITLSLIFDWALVKIPVLKNIAKLSTLEFRKWESISWSRMPVKLSGKRFWGTRFKVSSILSFWAPGGARRSQISRRKQKSGNSQDMHEISSRYFCLRCRF